MEQKICPECLSEFVDKKGRMPKRFCCLSCANKHKGKQQKLMSQTAYNINPRLCKMCNVIIPWKQNGTHKWTSFCSQSCNATYNNYIFIKKGNLKGAMFNRGIEETLERFERGEIFRSITIRKILIRLNGHACSRCNRTEWMGQPIPLELDHKDGNSKNNMPVNLRLLCATCHAQMPTSRGQNRGKGRTSIRKELICS